MFKDFLRDMRKMRTGNDGTRTLFESVMSPEVGIALSDWVKATDNNYVLVGGMALSFHVKPRYTEDIDILYLNKSDVPLKVNGFNKHRNHAFEHKKYGVEVELLDPEFINMPKETAKLIYDNAIVSNGYKIASKEGLIISKLFRFNRRDQADIEDVINNYKGNIDLSKYNLSKDLMDKYNSIADSLNQN